MDSSDWMAVGFMLGFILFVVLFGFTLVSCIVSCVVLPRTVRWSKRRHEYTAIESLTEEPEDDFLDTEDEEDYATMKAEEIAESSLTFWQKFRVEYKREMNGTNSRRALKKKEREEKKKMAKAVARQVDRLQRRRDQQENVAGSSTVAIQDIELPSYNTATELPVKE